MHLYNFELSKTGRFKNDVIFQLIMHCIKRVKFATKTLLNTLQSHFYRKTLHVRKNCDLSTCPTISVRRGTVPFLP